eukprot:m.113107 g.113107  ORF g.113107 m.113107 type:complete len:153 (+) comp14118_c0_seq4:93-551(+)
MAFSAKKLAEYTKEAHEAFAFYDQNHDGKINTSEIREVLQAVGQYPIEEDLKALLKKHSNGKEINSKQFIAMVKEHATANKHWEDELREAFKHFDEDRNGTIDAEEITHAMRVIGQKLSKKQAKEFVEAADTNGDGVIDYQEFISLLTSGRN